MRGALFLLCGLVGGLAGAVGYEWVRAEPQERATSPEPYRTSRGAGDDARFEALEQKIDELARRIESAREPGRGPASASPAGPDAKETAGGTPGEGGNAEPPLPRSVKEYVESLRGKAFGYDRSNRLFGWLTQNRDKIQATIEALLKEIEADPNNADLRVALATAWVAELTNNTQPGPQQGMVWGKASAAYEKAIELDPRHWQARYGLAFGTSMVPEFLGQRPRAIKDFEDLMARQERRAPEAHHVQTYFRLGTLYKDAGNAEKAHEIWERGLKLFPDSELLKDQLEVSTKK